MKLFRFPRVLVFVLCAAVAAVACDDIFGDPDDPYSPSDPSGSTEIGTNYSNSKVFQSDLDAIVTYALDLRAMRWAYFNAVSKNFTPGKAFSSTLDDIDGEYGTDGAEKFDKVVAHILDNASSYEAVMQRFEESGILSMPTTKGFKSDIAELMMGLKKTQTMGRQTVMAIITKGGWSSNKKKLEELYNKLPESLTRDCKGYTDFWNKFSKGELDSRANQVHVNLYKMDPMGYGERARILGVTPGRNIAIAGTDLISKGYGVVLDACPFADAVSYGKDAFNSIDATEKLFTEGNVEGFLQNALNNAINYGREVDKILDKMNKNAVIYWTAADNFWDSYGKDIVSIINNDVLFSNALDEALFPEPSKLIPNIVKTKDANGQDINLLIMVDDATGQMTLGYVLDKDGNVVVDPKLPGTKHITVVNKNTGRRVTKPVTVPKDKPTTVKINYDEESLEEKPADGYIQMRPSKLEIPASGGENWQAVIVSNYLYYAIDNAKSTGDWLKARVAKDNNLVYVSASANDTYEKRTGKITVNAVDSKGKKLNSTVLTVVQEAKANTDAWLSAEPSTLEFSSEGGAQETEFSWSKGLKRVTAIAGQSLDGWADYDWISTDSELKMKITVNPNGTGEDRSGTITVYAGVTEEDIDKARAGNLDPARAAKTTILVKQPAAGGQGDAPDLDLIQCTIRADFYGSINERGSNGGNVTVESTSIAYFGDDYSKESMTNYVSKNSKYYKDLNFRTYSVSTTKSGRYYIVNINVDFDYRYSKDGTFYKAGREAQVTIKLLPSNVSDINTYKVVYCYWKGKTFDDAYREKYEYEFEVEANLPFIGIGTDNYWDENWKYTKSYDFELRGSQLPANCVKKYRMKKYYYDSWIEQTINSISPSVSQYQNSFVTVRLFYKDNK